MVEKREKKKPFIALGINFDEVPSLTKEQVEDILAKTNEALRKSQQYPKFVRNPEDPHLSASTAKTRIK